MTRGVRSQGEGDAGVTLIELLVAITLLGTVGTVLTQSVVSGLGTQLKVAAHGVAISQVRTAVQRVTRELRDANPICAISPTGVTLQQPTTSGYRTLVYSVSAAGSKYRLTLKTTSGTCVQAASMTATQTTVISGLTDSAVFAVAPNPDFTGQTCVITGTNPVQYSPKCVGSVTLTITAAVGTSAADQGEYISVHGNTDVRNAE
jgi:prepilin-type N-terminal cleavage/methylation domain-containing protein